MRLRNGTSYPSPDQALGGRSDAARLVDEIGHFRAVMAACQAPGAHADIRQAVAAGASAHEAKALSTFAGRAASVQDWQPGEQLRLVRALAPLLDRVSGAQGDEASRVAHDVVDLTGVPSSAPIRGRSMNADFHRWRDSDASETSDF